MIWLAIRGRNRLILRKESELFNVCRGLFAFKLAPEVGTCLAEYLNAISF